MGPRPGVAGLVRPPALREIISVLSALINGALGPAIRLAVTMLLLSDSISAAGTWEPTVTSRKPGGAAFRGTHTEGPSFAGC